MFAHTDHAIVITVNAHYYCSLVSTENAHSCQILSHNKPRVSTITNLWPYSKLFMIKWILHDVRWAASDKQQQHGSVGLGCRHATVTCGCSFKTHGELAIFHIFPQALFRVKVLDVDIQSAESLNWSITQRVVCLWKSATEKHDAGASWYNGLRQSIPVFHCPYAVRLSVILTVLLHDLTVRFLRNRINSTGRPGVKCGLWTRGPAKG